MGDDRVDILIGKIIIKKNFATKEQVKEGLRLQRKKQKEAESEVPRLGAILLKKGYVSKEQVKNARRIQQRKIDQKLKEQSRKKESADVPQEQAASTGEPGHAVEKMKESDSASTRETDDEPGPNVRDTSADASGAEQVREEIKKESNNFVKTKTPRNIELDEDESVIFYSNPSIYIYVTDLIITFLVAGICYVAGLPWMVYLFPLGFAAWTYAGWINQEYAVTNRRVIFRKGVLTNEVRQSNLGNVMDISCEQSIAGEKLDFGHVHIDTAERQTGIVSWQYVSDPEIARQCVSKAKDLYDRNRRKEIRIERLKKKLADNEITQEQFAQAMRQIEHEFPSEEGVRNGG